MTVVVPGGNGGTASASQVSSGGNPGAFREDTINVNAGMAFVTIYSLRLGLTYDPKTQGAISSIDYSEDSLLINGAQGGGVALEQDGTIYSSIGGYSTDGDTTWTHTQLDGLAASFFQTATGSPDFSAKADPITFGYWRVNVNGDPFPGFSTQSAIDNWTITIHNVPEPVSVALPAVAASIILVVRRRSQTAV